MAAGLATEPVFGSQNGAPLCTALSLDTELQVVELLHVQASIAIWIAGAGRRRGGDDVVPAAARLVRVCRYCGTRLPARKVGLV